MEKNKDNKRYFLNVVEEYIYNPKYKDYIGGRVEIWDQVDGNGIGSDEEIRFLTKKKEEFYIFREKINLKLVNEKNLKKINQYIQKNFHDNVI